MTSFVSTPPDRRCGPSAQQSVLPAVILSSTPRWRLMDWEISSRWALSIMAFSSLVLTENFSPVLEMQANRLDSFVHLILLRWMEKDVFTSAISKAFRYLTATGVI